MGRTRKSKYDAYFEIDFALNKATCKTCQDIIAKNCYGMKKHLLKRHDINVDANDPEENEHSSPSKKAKVEIEPIEDQICREAAKHFASFR